MYSRNFFTDEKDTPTPPENYGGTALGEEEKSKTEVFSECKTCENEAAPEPCFGECKCRPSCGGHGEEHGASLLSGLFSGSFSSLFSGGGIKSLISHIGTEEILIIAVALFLLFSKEGDKECAAMLLFLLII